MQVFMCKHCGERISERMRQNYYVCRQVFIVGGQIVPGKRIRYEYDTYLEGHGELEEHDSYYCACGEPSDYETLKSMIEKRDVVIAEAHDVQG